MACVIRMMDGPCLITTDDVTQPNLSGEIETALSFYNWVINLPTVPNSKSTNIFYLAIECLSSTKLLVSWVSGKQCMWNCAVKGLGVKWINAPVGEVRPPRPSNRFSLEPGLNCGRWFKSKPVAIYSSKLVKTLDWNRKSFLDFEYNYLHTLDQLYLWGHNYPPKYVRVNMHTNNTSTVGSTQLIWLTDYGWCTCADDEFPKRAKTY